MTLKKPHKAFFDHLAGCAPYRSCLVLSGNLPDAPFFHELALPIIAADGAANSLARLDITPQLIVGDLDSAAPDVCRRTKCVHLPDQSFCDYEKALDYMGAEKLLPAIIVGMNGGYLDHILNNLAIFSRSGSLFYDPPIVGHLLGQGEHNFTMLAQSKISLLGTPQASVSSTGLKWNLERATLTFFGTNSCFNRTQSQSFSLQVHDGTLLALLYLEPIVDAGI